MKKQEIYSEPRKEVIIRVKKKKQKKSTYFFAAAAIIVLFILVTSAKSQKMEITTTTQEKYFIQAPVSEMKEFNISEIYYEKAEFTGYSPCRYGAYNFTENISWDYELVNGSEYFACRLNVTNNENKSGDWTYYAFIQSTSSDVQFNYLDQNRTIEPGATETFVWLHPVKDMMQDFICTARREDVPKLYKCGKEGTYSLIPKTRVVTTLNNVTHFVPIQQFKNITTTRNETGYINRFFGYKQPFYFGY